MLKLGDRVTYAGYGTLSVPWDCDAGPTTYADGGCGAELPTTLVEARVERS